MVQSNSPTTKVCVSDGTRPIFTNIDIAPVVTYAAAKVTQVPYKSKLFPPLVLQMKFGFYIQIILLPNSPLHDIQGIQDRDFCTNDF